MDKLKYRVVKHYCEDVQLKENYYFIYVFF